MPEPSQSGPEPAPDSKPKHESHASPTSEQPVIGDASAKAVQHAERPDVVVFKNVCKRFGRGPDARLAIEDVSFVVEDAPDIGELVTIQVGERKMHGRAEALDDSGALLLRTEHGI